MNNSTGFDRGQLMKMRMQFFVYLLAIVLLFGTSTIASSQDTITTSGQEREPGFSASVSYIHQFDTSIDKGGEFRLDRALIRADWKKKMSETVTLGVGAHYDYSGYSFSGDDRRHMTNPWDDINALNISVSALFNLDRNWKLFVAPSVGVSAESGADWGDSLVTGGIVWTSYRFSPSLTLGLGAGVFSKPEKISSFPLIIIDWKITDRLRLANPLQAGPSSPAGIELSYTFNGATVAVGGAYRSYRFRLDDHGPVPDGIGEDKSLPLWARLSAKVGKSGILNFFGGAMVGGKMRVEDSRGRNLSDFRYDASPFLAATVSYKF